VVGHGLFPHGDGAATVPQGWDPQAPTGAGEDVGHAFAPHGPWSTGTDPHGLAPHGPSLGAGAGQLGGQDWVARARCRSTGPMARAGTVPVRPSRTTAPSTSNPAQAAAGLRRRRDLGRSRVVVDLSTRRRAPRTSKSRREAPGRDRDWSLVWPGFTDVGRSPGD
jgi:hypothetical protein